MNPSWACGVFPDRPDLPYPGEWYELGGGQQLHLMKLPNPDAGSVRPEHGGRDHHLALGCGTWPR